VLNRPRRGDPAELRPHAAIDPDVEPAVSHRLERSCGEADLAHASHFEIANAQDPGAERQ